MTSSDHAQALARKAEEDIRLLAALCENLEITDAIWGFHAQQAVEKLLKSLLAHHQIRYPFIHQLDQLADLLIKSRRGLPVEFESLLCLTPFAAELRYPSLSVNKTPDIPLERAILLEKIIELRKSVWIAIGLCES